MGMAIPLGDFSFRFGGAGIAIDFRGSREDDEPADWHFWQASWPGAGDTAGHRLALALRSEGAAPAVGLRVGAPLLGFDPA